MNVPRVAALPVHTPETLAVGALAETIWPRDAAAQPAVRALHSSTNTAILIRTLPPQLTRSDRLVILDFRPIGHRAISTTIAEPHSASRTLPMAYVTL